METKPNNSSLPPERIAYDRMINFPNLFVEGKVKLLPYQEPDEPISLDPNNLLHHEGLRLSALAALDLNEFNRRMSSYVAVAHSSAKALGEIMNVEESIDWGKADPLISQKSVMEDRLIKKIKALVYDEKADPTTISELLPINPDYEDYSNEKKTELVKAINSLATTVRNQKGFEREHPEIGSTDKLRHQLFTLYCAATDQDPTQLDDDFIEGMFALKLSKLPQTNLQDFQPTSITEHHNTVDSFKQRWNINYPENTDYEDHPSLMQVYEECDALIQQHAYQDNGERKPGWNPEEDDTFWPRFRGWRDRWQEHVQAEYTNWTGHDAFPELTVRLALHHQQLTPYIIDSTQSALGLPR